MRFLSVCSGIEAASVAWHSLGWQAVAFSEIEPFPSAVLAHHYPGVPNLGDMTRFEDWPDAAVDVLVGGTPCQSFSVAGLRGGLADPRGNLMLTFGAIARRYRPEWLVWENVPGVLSSNGGRDFGTFLGMLAELGYGFAYRVLDAQYFGLAQRRKRVFVVGSARGWRRAAAVLFERHSLSGHPAPRREAGQGVAARALCSSDGGVDREDRHTLIPVAFAHKAAGAQTTLGYDPRSGTTPTLECNQTIAVAFAENSRAEVRLEGGDGQVVGALNRGGGKPGQGTPTVATAMQVRRLTPRECCRLQGFPDDYLDITYRGKPAADGPKYKALGNSMAVPVMAWIGSRIAAVQAITEKAAA